MNLLARAVFVTALLSLTSTTAFAGDRDTRIAAIRVDGDRPTVQPLDQVPYGWVTYDGMGAGNPNYGYQNNGYQNAGYQNAGYQNAGYQNAGYQNAGYQNNGYQNNGYYYNADGGYYTYATEGEYANWYYGGTCYHPPYVTAPTGYAVRYDGKCGDGRDGYMVYTPTRGRVVEQSYAPSYTRVYELVVPDHGQPYYRPTYARDMNAYAPSYVDWQNVPAGGYGWAPTNWGTPIGNYGYGSGVIVNPMGGRVMYGR